MVITMVNKSGGRGKTFSCRVMALMLKAIGYKVLVIDADHMTILSDKYSARTENVMTLYDVLIKNDPSIIREAIQTIKYEKEMTIKGFELSIKYERDIIPGSDKLRDVNEKLKTDPAGKYRLKNLLSSLDDYDFIFIDMPQISEINELVYNCLIASDTVIIPVHHELILKLNSPLIDALKTIKSEINDKLNFGILQIENDDCKNRRNKIAKIADEMAIKLFDHYICMEFQNILTYNEALAYFDLITKDLEIPILDDKTKFLEYLFTKISRLEAF